MRREGRAFFKTGTLNGIKTRAGYIENMVGGLYRFVVVVNTPGKAADHIMDMLLQGLD
jgi:D-alanyl-D-alanine carboxypeptidase/D-alanyl-D-alanine-endopeptidase (penicillin-binding protein 4)